MYPPSSGAPTAPPHLPEGWTWRTDPTTGSLYYIDPSGQSHWTPPTAQTAMPPTPGPGPPPGPPPGAPPGAFPGAAATHPAQAPAAPQQPGIAQHPPQHQQSYGQYHQNPQQQQSPPHQPPQQQQPLQPQGAYGGHQTQPPFPPQSDPAYQQQSGPAFQHQPPPPQQQQQGHVPPPPSGPPLQQPPPGYPAVLDPSQQQQQHQFGYQGQSGPVQQQQQYGQQQPSLNVHQPSFPGQPAAQSGPGQYQYAPQSSAQMAHAAAGYQGGPHAPTPGLPHGSYGSMPTVPPPPSPAQSYGVGWQGGEMAPAQSYGSAVGYQAMPGQVPSHQGSSYLQAQNSAAYAGAPGGGSSVELELSASGLRGKDLLSKSDPVCIVQIFERGQWKVAGKTEMIRNTNDPHWVTRVKLSYVFELYQDVQFVLKDVDSKTKDDDLGFVRTSLGAMLRQDFIKFDIAKKSSSELAAVRKDYGSLTVRVRQTGRVSQTRVKVLFSATKLDRADGMFGKSDPYFQVEEPQHSPVSAPTVLYRSEVIKNNLNPKWSPATFMVNTNGIAPHQAELDIRLMDQDDNSSDDPLGSVRCSLAALRPMATFGIINPEKQRKKGSRYNGSGTLTVEQATVTELPSFVQYLMGGCELRFCCAVDFTQSNGRPSNPKSLHYSRDGQLSLYGQALDAVGRVISPYLDRNQACEAFGFGAIIPRTNRVSFDFPLNIDSPDSAVVFGVDGLVRAYRDAVTRVRFSGPTNFSDILSRAMASSVARGAPNQQQQHFTVLLILTDGQCTDMGSTINKIVDASHTSPLAIVIVGIGNEDFSAMERLDGDGVALRGSRGQVQRDIVQFVRWKPHMGVQELSAEVLREIPNVVSEYMMAQNIRPNPPVQPQYGP